MEYEETIEKLENLVGKVKRLEVMLGNNVKTLGQYQENISEDSQALTLEVEEIKELRRSLVQKLSETLEEIVKSMAPELVKLIVRGFEENSRKFIDGNLAHIQKMTEITNEASSKANMVMSSYKRDLTFRRMGIAGAFWLGSLVSAGLVYYYFPQQVYFGNSDGFMKTYFVGRAVQEKYDALSEKDKTIILERFNKLYYPPTR